MYARLINKGMDVVSLLERQEFRSESELRPAMKHALERCDGEKKLAYLESSNPRNLSLYIRHGFEVIGTIQVADSPPVFPMLRKPRT